MSKGSFVGPIIFLSYSNDYTQFSVVAQCNLFADDALFYVYTKEIDSVNENYKLLFIALQSGIKAIH